MLLLLITSVLAVATAPDPDNVLAYYKMNNGTDAVGNYNLTYNTDLGTGIIDSDQEYTNANGDHMYITTNDFNFQEKTIAFWLKVPSKPSPYQGVQIYQNGARLGWWSAINVQGNGKYYFLYMDSIGAVLGKMYSTTDVCDNAWHHLAVVDNTTHLKMYVDNVLENKTIRSDMVYDTSMALYLGQKKYLFSTPWGYLDGEIDEYLISTDAYTDDNIDFLYNSSSPGSDQQFPFSNPTSYSETNVLFEQGSDVQVNSNTYQLVSSGSFLPINSSNATISGVFEVESSKDLEMQCKILVDSVDYDTEVNRSFDSASVGNIYTISSEFEVTQGVNVSLDLYCRRTSSLGGNIIVSNGVGIVHLLTSSDGSEINHLHISENSGSIISSTLVLISNTTFNTSNLSATGLSRQLIIDGMINYHYTNTGTLSAVIKIGNDDPVVFSRRGTTGSSGNGGAFSIGYNFTGETEVPILIYKQVIPLYGGRGNFDINLTVKEMIGHKSMFNQTGSFDKQLTSSTWATAETITINNSEHATGDLVVKASPSTYCDGYSCQVTYRLYYNNSGYSPEYVRTVYNLFRGVTTLQYLFTDVGTGLFDVELQYKLDSGVGYINDGNLIAYISGDIKAVPNVFLVNASNLWNSSAITSFNVSVNGGTTFFESNSSGIATISAVNPSNLTISSANYIDRVYLNHNTSNDLEAKLYQSIMWVNITEAFSSNPISNWTLYNGSIVLINTTSSVDVFYPNQGEYNSLTLHSNNGAFSDRIIDGFNVTSLEQNTIYYELFPTELNITAESAISSIGIDSFSIVYSSLNSSHSGTYSTTGGELIFGVINGDTYNITIDASTYALFNNSVNKLISGNSAHKFFLYTNNSISFNIRWETDNSLVTNLTNILLTSDITSYLFNTSNGTHYEDNIIDGAYSVKASITGLDDKYYSITIADRSHQDLTIYFDTNYSDVTFLFQDKNTGTAIEGVYFSLSRFVNGSLVAVSSKLSDITGSVTAKYVNNTFYTISGSKSGYATKTFSLDPIDSSTYIVKMEFSSSQVFISDSVSIYYSPKTFTEGLNNFSFTINSPLGLLSSYYFNVSYPDSYNNYSGNNANGEVFSFAFNITNPEMFDSVKVNYYYLTSLSGTDNKTFYHPIGFVNSSSIAWGNMDERFSDLGIFERIMLVVLAVILVAGFGYLVAGFGGSLALGLLVYVFFAATGFIPLWTILLALFVGSVLVFRGGIFG